MIIYHIFDSDGENFILSTKDIETAMEYADRGFQVTSVSPKDNNEMWSDYQI
jgi:hypothetical protein